MCVVGCIVAVLAACGSSSPGGLSTSTNDPVSSSTPATPSPAATPASLSQLEQIVLQTADLPSGWAGKPYQPDPNESADNAAFDACVGTPNTESDQVAEAHSDNFAAGLALIASSATSFRSQSDLDAGLTMLHSPKVSPCFTQLIKTEAAASLPAGTTIESASIKVTPGSAGGPPNVVATGSGTISVQLNGEQLSVYATVAFITGPLIEAELVTESVSEPVPAAVVNPLVTKMAGRATAG
jgi:hypothetical protein